MNLIYFQNRISSCEGSCHWNPTVFAFYPAIDYFFTTWLENARIFQIGYLRFITFVAGIAESDVSGPEQQFGSLHQPGRVRQPAVLESAASPEQPVDVRFDFPSAGAAVARRTRSQLQPVDRSIGAQHVAPVTELANHIAGAQPAQQRPAWFVRRARRHRVPDAQP